MISPGCSSPESEWGNIQEAETANSREKIILYQEFLQKYPDSHYSSEAQSKIEELEWDSVKETATIESLSAFIDKYPDASLVNEAREMIDILNALPFSTVEPGVYAGSGAEVESFTITLVKTADTLMIGELAYSFEGSLGVKRAFLNTNISFGRIEQNTLRFQFPVMVKFSFNTSILSESGGSAGIAFYSAELRTTDVPGELNCRLVQIDALDEEYSTFTAENITLRTPAKEMQKEYMIHLQKANR